MRMLKRWALWGMLVFVLFCAAGCTLEQAEQNLEKGKAIGQTFEIVLPGPFKLIGTAIAGICAIGGGIVAKKKSNRAKTAELQAAAEMEAKLKYKFGLEQFTDLINKMKTMDATKAETEAFLAKFKEVKNAAEPWVKSALSTVELVRKGMAEIVDVQAAARAANGSKAPRPVA